MTPAIPQLHQLWQTLCKELQPKRLMPSLTIGLTTGVLGVLFDLSFAALIFSGSLSAYLSAGVGLVLVSAAITRVMVALMSALPFMVADLGTVPTAILAWSAGMVVKQLPPTATSTEILITVIATIALTSVLTGLLLFAIGLLRLGNWVQLLPEPVVGGFVASTGWLLAQGSFKLMMEQPLSFKLLPLLNQPEHFVQWVPGLLLALYLLMATHRRLHPLVIPGSLLVAIALFYLGLPLMGTSATQAIAQGLTLGVPQFETTWQLLSWHDLSQIHWGVIASQWMCSATVMATTAITLMMNVQGMALMTGQDLDTNRELKVAGVVNLLMGLGGGILSFHSMNKSLLAYKMGGRSRLATLVGAAVFVLLPMLAAPLLTYFPKPILGGLLLYLGLSLLLEWVYRAWSTLSKLDYGIVQSIWLVSGMFGFLQGLALGWGWAVVLLCLRGDRWQRVKSDA
ncbi:sodium-independent anion transporter [filamentous cyanobacterium CCP4]|nr:sodium-independent anion transporter [filamentous cyanobacterium CCP4]